MSWAQTQGVERDAGGAPLGSALGAALGAVWAASQKGNVAQVLAQMEAGLAAIPDDIDWGKFNAGVARYGAQAVRPVRTAWPVLAQRGRVTLRDAGGEGAPLVLVPSMVNKGYVLDLCPGHSMVEGMRAQGFRVLVVDWGEPAEGVLFGSMGAVVEALEGVLRDAVAAVGPVHLFGYCMGGLLALGAAVRLGKEPVRSLSTAAMPWDFSYTPTHGYMAAARAAMVGGLPDMGGVVPAAAMQVGFFLLDPWSPVRRLMAFAEADEARMPFMTALEDWLADPLALDGALAREMLVDWHADNRTLRGAWQVGGVGITPAALEMPWWACVCQKDVLVPPMSALAAVGQGKDVAVHMADTGHVGLVCGRRATVQLYGPLGGWLARR